MVIASERASRLAHRITRRVALVVLSVIVLAVAVYVVVLTGGLLAPEPEPVLMAPLRWW